MIGRKRLRLNAPKSCQLPRREQQRLRSLRAFLAFAAVFSAASLPPPAEAPGSVFNLGPGALVKSRGCCGGADLEPEPVCRSQVVLMKESRQRRQGSTPRDANTRRDLA